ncbi:MAG: BrnT family toxin [Phycisphaerae bacterium]
MGLNFEWDAAKARSNRRKHKVASEEAATVFGDPRSLTIYDPDHSIIEER